MIERCNGQSASGNACNNIANAKNLFSSLAELLQRPQRGKWSLQNFCKCPKEKNGACRTSANAQKRKMVFAGLLQMSKRRKWSLQNFCKCPKGEIGACRTPANAQKEKSELAELLQMSKRRKWRLQGRCKHFQRRFSQSQDLRRNSLLALFLCRTHANKKLFRIY